MFFNWLKSRRRAQILSNAISQRWKELISLRVPQVDFLKAAQREKLYRHTQIFVAEKNWEGLNGLTLTEDMKVTIAAMMGLLVCGFREDEYFDHVLSILVQPGAYVAKSRQQIGTGMIIEGQQARAGEAWYRGPVIVSWEDVSATAENETFGHNVVIHEFAHQLDMLNGRIADGDPIMESDAHFDRWDTVMGSEYNNLINRYQSGQRDVIDHYATTNRAEFFAVTTEMFFEAPTPLRYWHPEVYEQLSDFYRLDPASWGTEGDSTLD
ncbi:zinc-dependent peptidase [Planctomicrobium sp. SH668]|uniref:M90 family metallopeptidase n=1 Tax=Planctomicrobium sp. SH668 TaxID=3448126 RepID=UPI003F5B7E78